MARALAKRDFGSFHASNVQELINLAEARYIPPEIPDDIKEASVVDVGRSPFAPMAKTKYFCLQKDCIFLNHGAFGAVLSSVLTVSQMWQKHIEMEPVRFFDRELLPHLVFVTRRLASFVGCEPKDIVLVENVTTALSSIFKSLVLTKSDIVFSLSMEYGAVKKMITETCSNTGATHQEEHVTFPMESTEEILDIFEDNLKPETRVVVFDHIPSNTPFIMPVEEIVPICRRKCPDARIIVDGAHALLALPLNIPTLDVDYYVSNCHKWFCGPKGTAFMYVKEEHQPTTHPLVISHGWGSGFSSEFVWQGLRDYSGFLALHAAIDFWTMPIVHDQCVRQRNNNLARDAADMLVERWNSFKMTPDELNGCMICVQLPYELYGHLPIVEYEHAEVIQNDLLEKYGIEVPIKAVQGNLYVRISVHVYNEMREYIALADAVLALTKKQALNPLAILKGEVRAAEEGDLRADPE